MRRVSVSAVMALALGVLLLAGRAAADIASFSETIREWNVRVIRSLEMYGTANPPARGPPGNGDAYIRAVGTISVDEEDVLVSGSVTPFVIDGDTLDAIGTADTTDPRGEKVWYCCDADMYAKGGAQGGISPDMGCTAPNSLVVPKELRDTVHLLPPVVFNNASSVDFTTEFSVKNDGVYILMFAHCDIGMFQRVGKDNTNSTLWIEGQTMWMNPYGYLPGRLYGFLPFFGWMCVVFMVVGVLWLALNAYHWKDVSTLQHYITAMLVVVLIEVTVWYFDYRDFNSTGTRRTGVVVFGILMSVIRMTVSRLLVVAVSVGFGVVKPDLGKNKLKLIALGLVYFACETALELVIRYGQTNNAVAQNWRFVLSFPVAILNAVTYWWIFFALYRITAQLTIRKQLIKLQLYKRFSGVLVFSMVAAVAFALYQMYYLWQNMQTLHWSSIWLLDGGFSFVLYSVVLLSIAFLWRPSASSHRYAYASVARSDEENDAQTDFGLDGTGGAGPSDDFADLAGVKRQSAGPDTMDDEVSDSGSNANAGAGAGAGVVSIPMTAPRP